MILRKNILICAFLAILGCKQANVPQATSARKVGSDATSSATPAKIESIKTSEEAETVRSLVKASLDKQYGAAIDVKLGCYRVSLDRPQAATEYCMHPGEPHVVGPAGDRRIFVHSYSDPSLEYGKLDPGMMGAFEIALDGPRRGEVIAAEKARDSGTEGECGCKDAKFVQVGDATWGWLYTTGQNFSGEVTLDHSLLVSRGGKFVDVLKGAQEGGSGVSLQIEPIKTPGKEFYSLELRRISAQGVDISKVVVDFDAATGSYKVKKAN